MRPAPNLPALRLSRPGAQGKLSPRTGKGRKGKPTLTAERLRSFLVYDAFDGGWHWLVDRGGGVKAGDAAGYIDASTGGRRVISVDGTDYLASRLAHLWMRGLWPRRDIDHRDGHPGNDAFENLRQATPSQNAANSRLRSTNTSGFKWSYLDKRTGRWRAQIKIKGKLHYIGCFATAPEAHMAAWVKAREGFGAEFVRLR